MEKNLVIQRAYKLEGLDWETIYLNVDRNGYLDPDSIYPEFAFPERFDYTIFGIRPKRLQGIENNNGWTKLAPDYKLPKYSFYCRIVLKTGRTTVGEFVHTMKQFNILRSGYVPIEKITHYQELHSQGMPLF
jgi:hypothetical protein